jgi:hypothetical protein
VLFHKRNVRRNHSLGTALHKAKYLLFGWRVKIIKKDTTDAPPLSTMGYEEVIITPGKCSSVKPGIQEEEKRCEKSMSAFRFRALSPTNASRMSLLSVQL